MRPGRVALTLLPVALWGCVPAPRVHEDDKRLSRMLCEVGEQRVTLSPRFSYDLPGPLRHTPCGTIKSGFNYDKVRDIQSASAAGGFRSDDLVVLASSRWITVESLLDGKDEGTLYSPEQFLQNKLALMDLPQARHAPKESIGSRGKACNACASMTFGIARRMHGKKTSPTGAGKTRAA